MNSQGSQSFTFDRDSKKYSVSSAAFESSFKTLRVSISETYSSMLKIEFENL